MKQIEGTIEAMEIQLKSVIKDYCNSLGCKECPFNKNCLATTLENSIYEKEKNKKQCNHEFYLDKLKNDIICNKCRISKYLL